MRVPKEECAPQKKGPEKMWSRAVPRLSLPLVLLGVLSAMPSAAAEKTLFSFWPFPPDPSQRTGEGPDGTLLRDANGSLYGATLNGGEYYNGTIYKLTPPAPGRTQWTYTVLYSFTGGFDGGSPNSALVMDKRGVIYGTTQSGGSWTNQGLVYKLTPPAPGEKQWTETPIYYFAASNDYDDPDGTHPIGGLIMDNSEALYGTTNLGGRYGRPGTGFGTVFKLSPLDRAKTRWKETVLYNFKGGADGNNPAFELTGDSAGAVYGTTLYGGAGHCIDWFSEDIGCGTVFKLTPPAAGKTTWTKTTLHNFTTGRDGAVPEGKLLLDTSGALYGATFQGGTGQCPDGLYYNVGCGIVYKLTPPGSGRTTWTETILHEFTGPEGAHPQGGLIKDATGALIGTTYQGGPLEYGVVGSYGVAYKLIPPRAGQNAWTTKVLYNFKISTSGDNPVGELVRDPLGNLFGVAYGGGSKLGGTIFEITP
jgi:hypothetical protein